MEIQMFNFWYFFWLVVCAGLFFGLYFLLKNKREKVQKGVLFGLLVFALCMIALNLAQFRYVDENGSFKGGAMKELLCLAGTFVYAFIEIYLLQVEPDPFYFLPGNEVMGILGVSYPVYLILYVVFLTFYYNLFYLIPYFGRNTKRKKPFNGKIKRRPIIQRRTAFLRV